MAIEIKTNRVPRDLLDWSDLTKAEQSDFDYIDDTDSAYARFFRYRGAAYDVNEFMRVPCQLAKGWDGYSADSYFSGVLIRLVDNCERVIVGRYFG